MLNGSNTPASFSKFCNQWPSTRQSDGARRLSVNSPRFHYEGDRNDPSYRRASLQKPLLAPSRNNLPGLNENARHIRSLTQDILKPLDAPVGDRNELRRTTADIMPPFAVPPSSDTHKADSKLIIESLAQMPHIGASATKSCLDVHEQMILHQLDQMDAEERNALRFNSMTEDRPNNIGGEFARAAVFGIPLRKSAIYASASVLLGGRELELPIVVVSCVEELYRTGLYQPNLFFTLPNPHRLRELVDAFNREIVPSNIILTPRPKAAKRRLGTAFGGHISLHLEATADICSLLSTYLMSLPDPLFGPGNRLFDAMWDWCGVDERVDEGGRVPYDGKHVSSVQMNANQVWERQRIRAAQLILHLLPSPNFDLLVYLLAFFSQVVLVGKENGLGVQDLGKMFGKNLFGDGAEVGGEPVGGSARQEDERGVRMMCWLLRQWSGISHHLFDIPMLLNQEIRTSNIQQPLSPETVPVLDKGFNQGSPTSSVLLELQEDAREDDRMPTTFTYTYPKEAPVTTPEKGCHA